ncbi:hypothetical protein [Asticcacaulis sp. W401b]|uniref:hypothetical protein n=1 Tax=Asticcacaulis sp. W401b TaxID=3388666 RepID=UPI003970A56D
MSQAKTDLHPRPEKTIGSHWLRGGQTLSHTWAMVIEVLKNFSIPAILLGFLMINVVNHSADDLDQIYV